jgi:hypothetical protein
MSLINDALKRAKQSQSPAATPPAQHLHFRPVESEPVARHGLGVLLPVALAFVALLALLFVWELGHRSSSSNPQPELVAHAASTTPAPTPPVNPAPAALTESVPSPPVPSAPEPPPAAITPTPAETAPDPAPAIPAVPDDPPTPPKPAPLRLQGIIFNPAHPSAVINGKTVFVGDKVGEFRVGDIRQDSATLFNAAQTNVLNLGE